MRLSRLESRHQRKVAALEEMERKVKGLEARVLQLEEVVGIMSCDTLNGAQDLPNGPAISVLGWRGLFTDDI